ncbi:MAG TPA: hypothetical protein VKG62_05720 [Solirubrobacteraceae bacterium]|nr:hypothetical protein [Solirubrobacteraceae bacterium]
MLGARTLTFAVGLAALLAPSAADASITIGSPLASGGTGVTCGSSCTQVTIGSPSSGPPIESPISGTIVRWRLSTVFPGTEAQTVALRVLVPNGVAMTGAGKSAPGAIEAETKVWEFATDLPIAAGDVLGLDVGPHEIEDEGLRTGASSGVFAPALGEGGAPTPPSSGFMAGREVELNADVAELPTSTAAVPVCSSGTAAATVTPDVDFAVQPKAVRYRIDGDATQSLATSGNPGTAAIPLPAGAHTLEYWGEDNFGGQEATHHTATFDTTPPTVSVVSDQGKSAYALGEPASITVQASDAGSGLAVDPSGAHIPISTAVAGSFVTTETATDRCGNSTGASFAYTVAASSPVGGGPPAAAPVLSALSLSPSRFLAARSGPSAVEASARRGTVISYHDSQAAVTAFTVLARRPGVRHGTRCLPPRRSTAAGSHSGRHCTRLVSQGGFSHPDRPGPNRLRFTGRLRGRTMPAGAYELEAVARDGAGLSSRPVTEAFRIAGSPSGRAAAGILLVAGVSSAFGPLPAP